MCPSRGKRRHSRTRPITKDAVREKNKTKMNATENPLNFGDIFGGKVFSNVHQI